MEGYFDMIDVYFAIASGLVWALAFYFIRKGFNPKVNWDIVKEDMRYDAIFGGLAISIVVFSQALIKRHALS